MPELPDVEYFSQYLDATALHQCIAAVHVQRDDVLDDDLSSRRLVRQLKGRAFQATRRHGKHLPVELDDGGFLVLHFGMTGYLDYAMDRGDPPAHTRLRIDFDNGYRLAYVCQRMLGHVALAEDMDAFVKARELGPDALALDKAGLRERLEPHRGMVKPVLMDQSVLAGLGNVYTDEILFHARLHPRAPIADFDDDAYTRLYRSLRHVLQRAIDAHADPERMPRTWLLPHRQPDAECPRCSGQVQRTQVGGRSTYACPSCQPPP